MSLSRLPTPAVLAGVYLSWISLGAMLLKLPFSTVSPITWSDAWFTATSAVTVTGLVVVDTGPTFSTFGQGVLMLLIQLGGMGLMTFAVVLLSSFGMQIGLAQRRFLQEEIGLSKLGGLLELAWAIFRIVLVGEMIGFVLLSFAFVPDEGWGRGMWLALFQSISAFNNAGFSLFPDSVMGYTDRPLVLVTLSLQFILGGLGFAVISDMYLSRRWSGYSLHTRLMLTGTISLIVLSIISFAILEWNNPGTIGALDTIGEKLNALWFEAVTPRTAGFNSVDTAAMHQSTTLLTILLMIIGGGSTSTAGGLKVTTAFVLLLATFAFFRKSGTINAFGYRIGLEQGLKVMALLTVSIFVLFLGLFLLVATHNLPFLDLAFETASAFGTVGLSRGITSDLNHFGRFIICVMMFIGRIGPLSLGFFLANKRPPRVSYPEGTIFLG